MTNTLADHSGDPLVEPGEDPHTAVLAALTNDLGGVLESMEQVSDYLERVVHAVRRHIDGCDEVGITVMSADRPHTAAYTTVQTLEIDAVQYALNEGPCLDAARHRRENHVPDLVVDDGRWPNFAHECREEGMRSLLALPLLSGTECVGAINLYAWAPHAFDAFDAALVRVAAARCADALVAVTVLDGARRLAGQLEQAMASRAVIEQAKGVIMAMRGVPEHEAFEVLRKTSQDRNVKVRVLAQQIVTGVSTPDDPKAS
ncbi:GAF and ANTAR domain-containing protein [Oryzobacter telluris]|uniref:GAF and ANTAR domain-containing protein n=1 Tax=Oryzobacter telluris TaxID=3149179 RepID=UPI00370CFDE7